jgi:hypothetical protein
MPIIAQAKAGDFKPVPEGVHDALCVFIIDAGYEHSEEWNKEIHKIYICWEINEPMTDGRPFMISKKYTLSLSDKAALRKDLEGWRGKKFTDEQLKGFDIEVLKGLQCKIYANIQTVLPKSKTSVPMTQVVEAPPEWIMKIKQANEDRIAQMEGEPSPVAKPKLPLPDPNEDTTPF